MNTSYTYTYIGDAFLILNDLYGGAGLTFSPNSHTLASTARISTNRALSSSSSSSSSSNRRSGGDISMTRISIASSGIVGYLYTIIICMLYTMLYYVILIIIVITSSPSSHYYINFIIHFIGAKIVLVDRYSLYPYELMMKCSDKGT